MGPANTTVAIRLRLSGASHLRRDRGSRPRPERRPSTLRKMLRATCDTACKPYEPSTVPWHEEANRS